MFKKVLFAVRPTQVSMEEICSAKTWLKSLDHLPRTKLSKLHVIEEDLILSLLKK